MPTLTREDIVTITDAMLRAGGAPSGHASTVANHLADANFAGHDSHGFIRIPQYMSAIKDGSLDPRAEPEIVGDSAATAHIDGHGTFGQVVCTMATKLAIDKAREYGISLVAMGNLDHTGRLGTYPEMAIREGMAAIMFTGGFSPKTGHVAPFGGRTGRLGTNPIAMGFPGSDGAPLLLDFATSIAAEGKLRLYRNRGYPLPGEWLVDKDGAPTNDPNAYYEGGALLPLGGATGGHKGYALSVMVVLFGGLLGQAATPQTARADSWDGSSILVIDLGRMSSSLDIGPPVKEMTRQLRETPTAEGFDAVLTPGEVETNARRDRLANGVIVDQATWDQVSGLFEEYGVAKELAGVGQGG